MAMKSISELEVIKYFTPIPSLKRISAIAVVINLWRHQDIHLKNPTALLQRNIFYDDTWEKVENKVLKKLSHISLPESLSKLVQDIIKPLGQEIATLLRHYWVFKKPEDMLRHTNAICWKSNGAIDYEKTGKALLYSKDTTVEDKWDIACRYFLVEDILRLAPENACKDGPCVSKENFDSAKLFLHYAVDCDAQWDDVLWKHNYDEGANYNIHEFAFDQAIQCNNGFAVKYFWNTFSNEEKQRNIVRGTTNAARQRNADIMCFLLSQMNKNEQNKIFKNCILDVLDTLLTDWKWFDFFLPTVNHVQNYLSAVHYFYILEMIVNMMLTHYNANDKYRAVFDELWKKYAEHVRKDAKNVPHYAERVLRRILKELFYLKDQVNFMCVFSEITLEQKKGFIFSSDGIYICCDLIMNNNWDFLKIFMEQTLLQEEDELFFKFELLQTRGRHICNTFLDKNQWAAAEQFLAWCFESENEVKDFKKNLIKHRYLEMVHSVFTKKETDFFNMEQLLCWCFSNQDEIGHFKTTIILNNLATFSQLVLDLIKQNEWHLAEKFLIWNFTDDQIATNVFKHSVLKELYNANIYATYSVLWSLVIKGDAFKSLEKVLRWCAFNDEDLLKFKSKLLIIDLDKNFNGVCGRLLLTQNYELATEFVDWCYSSSAVKVNEFKLKLIMTNGFRIFQRFQHVKSDVVRLVEWFNPSVETVARLKEKHVGSKFMTDFFLVLDKCCK